jgi:hypothetical protein
MEQMELMMIKDSSKFKFECEMKMTLIEISYIYFSRTPGSRQPSPNEEHLNRLHGLDPSINVNMSGFSQPMMQQMMNNHDQHQMNSSFHPQHPQHPQNQHHPMGHPVLNGMQVQVTILNSHSILMIMKFYFYVEKH